MKISFLIVLLCICFNTQAGDRLQGIAGSMGKSNTLFSKLFGDDVENEDVDTPIKRQREEITLETKLETEQDAAQIKNGERHADTTDDSASFSPVEEKKLIDTTPEIDIISDINAQFETTINKLQATKAEPKIKTEHKRPTQLFINKNTSIHTANIQGTGDECVREKVYSLDVENAAQYERLEDFPFTYECVIQR